MRDYECELDVWLLGTEEQVILRRGVSLPFSPRADDAVAGLGTRFDPPPEDPEAKPPAMSIRQVVWNNDDQVFWCDCGVIDVGDDDLDVILADWPDWRVAGRSPRTAEIVGADGLPGGSEPLPVMLLAPHRQVDREEPKYSVMLDADDDDDDEVPYLVLYADGTFAAEDDARRVEWLFDDRFDAMAALSKYYLRQADPKSEFGAEGG